MPKESKPARLWKWSGHTDKPVADAPKTSLAYPEDAQQSGTTLIPVVNKTFQGETVVIDGRNFINCEFTECSIHWNGNDFIFTTCTFLGAQNLATSLQEVATAMKLAGACGLLDENAQGPETRSGRKGGK